MVRVHYEAVSVNAVLNPSNDPVALMLDLWQGKSESIVEIRQNRLPLKPKLAGRDVTFDQNRRSSFFVNRPRIYELVRNPGCERNELELIF